MTIYLKRGTTFKPTSEEALDMHKSLPVGNYVVKISLEGYYLERIDSFDISFKLYGDIEKNSKRILNTFNLRPNSTGVLLCGEKGSGKSLLAKHISIQAATQNIPTLIVNEAWHDDQFNAFLQMINQPCVVLMDEYEKTYTEEEHQFAILTLLDGVYPSKKLFVLTVNDKYKVDVHMRNRPGRIYYVLDYDGISEEFIREYCNDALKNKADIDKIVHISKIFHKFNFDMLKAIVEEMNRYGESVTDAIKFLNVKPEFGSEYVKYHVELKVNGKEIKKGQFTEEVSGNPLDKPFSIRYLGTVGKQKQWIDIPISPNEIEDVINNGESYVFVNETHKAEITLKRPIYSSYNYVDYLD